MKTLISPTLKKPEQAAPGRYLWKAKSLRDDFLPLDFSKKTLPQLLETRRTVYPTAILPTNCIASIVREVCRFREIGTNSMVGRGKTSTISAGALQTITVLILNEKLEPLVYDRWEDKALVLEATDADGLDREITFLREAAGTVPGHILLFVADKEPIDAVYNDSETLALRDCGALLQSMSMCCSALDVAFVPLGPLGEAALSMLLGSQDKFAAVGTAVVGQAS